VAAIAVGGIDLLVAPADAQAPGPLHWGCYPMAPWAGRLGGGRLRFEGVEHRFPLTLAPHAVHGTVWAAAWNDDGHDGTSARLRVPLEHPWPFGGHVVHRVALAPDHLRLTLEVHADDRPMPAACGWHPWFRRQLATGRPAHLDLAAGAMWQRGPDGLPTGELVSPPPGPWDDCFTDLARPPMITWPEALTVTLTSSCRQWVVYDEPVGGLCVEPQTAPPDSLNRQPDVVAPGQALVADATLTWATPPGERP
jgi:galactose mutarotase-like enzyme